MVLTFQRIRRFALACGFCMVVTGCTTLPHETSTAPWSFAVIADNRGGGQSHRAAMESVKAANHEMILNLGDMVYPGEGNHWQDFLADMRAVFGDGLPGMLKRYFVTVGGWEEQYVNQSRRTQDPPIPRADWQYAGSYAWPGYEPDNAAGQSFAEQHFGYRRRAQKTGGYLVDYDPYGDYYVKYRNLHILSLYLTDEWHRRETFGPHDDPRLRAQAWERQIRWLDDRLNEIRGTDPEAPIIVMGHDAGWVAKRGDSFRGRLCKLLAKHRVDIAFCADGHQYVFFPDPTTLKFMAPACLEGKGAGYMSVTVDGSRLTVRHRDTSGKVLHEFQKTAGKPI